MNWIDHFTQRYTTNLDVSEPSRSLNDSAMKRIAYSIAQFQRGESSSAEDYLQKSYRFSEEQFAPFFHVESMCFIREENAHARWLKAFMEEQEIPLATRSWTDGVFRWLRRGGDLAWSSRVLMTAEVLAQLYYPALRAATSHPSLQAICQRIIEDEAHHIQFQIERIARIERTHSAMRRVANRVLNYVLFLGTAIVVWMEHRPVLHHSMSAWRYFKLAWARFNYVDSSINQSLCEFDIQHEEEHFATPVLS